MYYTILIIGIAVGVALVYMLLFRRQREMDLPRDPLEHMKALIRQGVFYEEDFITTYFKVVNDEGFMRYFGTHEKEASELLNTMIEDSTGHRNVLNNIIENAK